MRDEHRGQYTDKEYSVQRVGGCEFHIYMYYDESEGEELPDLPDFYGQPEYTDDGRPFALVRQWPCTYSELDEPDKGEPVKAEHDEGEEPDVPVCLTLYESDECIECGECKYFAQGEPPGIIGVCMCDERIGVPSSECVKPEREFKPFFGRDTLAAMKDKFFRFSATVEELCRRLRDEKKEFVISEKLLQDEVSVGQNIREALLAEDSEIYERKICDAKISVVDVHYWVRRLRHGGYIDSVQEHSYLNNCREIMNIVTTIRKE